MRLTEAIQTFAQSHIGMRAQSTIQWYTNRLTNLAASIGDVEIESITLNDLRTWRAALASAPTHYTHHPTRPPESGQLSPHTLHGHIRAIRHFFKWLTDEGMLSTNPARRLELPKLPREPRKGIAQRDVEKIISAARDNPRDYAICLFLADTACRVGGLCNLKLENLDLNGGRAIVREKGNKSRIVYLSPRTVTAVRAWLTERPQTAQHQFVFTGTRGPLTPSGAYQIIKRLAKQANVADGWNPHNWRHGAARAMLQNGASLAHVSQILGHEDVSVTVHFYGTFADAELQNAHNRYTWLNTAGDS